MFPRIFIALDGGAPAARAARTGIALAEALSSEVALFHAVEPPGYAVQARWTAKDVEEFAREQSERVISEVADEMPQSMGFTPLTRVGDPAQVILAAAADWEADLIVLGSHGRDGVLRAVLGSVAEVVMRHSDSPVLVVRATALGGSQTHAQAEENA